VDRFRKLDTYAAYVFLCKTLRQDDSELNDACGKALEDLDSVSMGGQFSDDLVLDETLKRADVAAWKLLSR
jgi:hypothetical protein